MKSLVFKKYWQVTMFLVLCTLLGCPTSIMVAIPNLVTLDYDLAQEALSDLGLYISQESVEPNNLLPAGVIIRHSPSAGAMVPVGTVVGVVISSGPATIVVPFLVDMSRSLAEDTLNAVFLRLGNVTEEYSDSIPSGHVIRQNPAAGTRVSLNSFVSLVISKGKAPITVPSVVGLSQSIAQTSIQNAGLTVGSVTQNFSSSVAVGNVISQDPSGGSTLAPGASVSLVVSRGPQFTTVPDLRGLLRSSVESMLADLGLLVGAETEAYSNTVPLDRIISSNPEQGSMVSPGSAVAIVISLGAEPIVINDITELQKVGNDSGYPINGNYVLAGNIDANTTAVWNGGKGFAPLGSSSTRFTGRFDGGGYTIFGLAINRASENYIGLFGYIGSGGTVENVILSGGSVIGRDYVGCLVGFSDGQLIGNCKSSTSVTGEDYVGGLVGATSGNVEFCHASGSVTGSECVGGVVGWSSAAISDSTATGYTNGYRRIGGLVGKTVGSVLNCLAEGPVTGTSQYVGGLVGVNEEGAISLCGSTGSVNTNASRYSYVSTGGLVGWHSGTLYKSWSSSDVVVVGEIAGGLVGYHYKGTISQCLAEGSVEGNDVIGGLVGESEGEINQSYAVASATARDSNGVAGGLVGRSNRSTIVHCYAAGQVLAEGTVGGLVGTRVYNNAHIVMGSFWDIQTTGVTESQGGEGRTTVQMKAATNFTSAGWDLMDVWGLTEGTSYPYLRWAAAL